MSSPTIPEAEALLVEYYGESAEGWSFYDPDWWLDMIESVTSRDSIEEARAWMWSNRP